MLVEEYIKLLTPYVEEVFKNDGGSHDITHLIRTSKTALYIQEKEGGDRIVIGIAAFLHDVHRIMQNELGHFVSPKDSLDKVREILSNVELTDEQIEKICYAIEYHEEYNWNGENVDDINTLILQDADNLDAIGAIGIARAFTFGGEVKKPLFDENIPLDESDTYVEENAKDPTTIHHFYHKLFKLESNMNTQTGKEIARRKTECMRQFVNEFLNEWNANY